MILWPFSGMTPQDDEKFTCKLKDFVKVILMYSCDIVLYLNLLFPLKNSSLSFMLKHTPKHKSTEQ